jgi:adenosine deaminase
VKRLEDRLTSSPCAICPTSNLLTSALPDEDALRDSIRTFADCRVRFTIATDGPEMMQTHLSDEFALLDRIGALGPEELLAVNALGHDAAFLNRKV